jgi:hypothetical protein
MNPPDWVRYVNQASERFDQQQLDEAANLAEHALRLNPSAAGAHQILGMVTLERDRPREAMPFLERALALRPDLPLSYNALGRCYTLLGDLDRGLACLDTALFLQPSFPMAHFNRSLVWLKQGRFKEGWNEYEWRWTCGLVPRPEIPCPRWAGTRLDGRAILVHTEQGFGDTLLFLRLLPLLRQRVRRLVLACPKQLQPLLRPLPYVDEWFPIDEPGLITFELYTPLLSLPGLLGIEEATIPQTVPYISPDPARVARWGEQLKGVPGLKVGLCWQGSPTLKTDSLRSIPLAQFAPLAAVPGVTLFSLQKGAGVEQIAALRGRVPVHELPGLDTDGAFVDTAAVLQHLDLVITIDTAIAHVAGALARPVWMLLSTGSDWRWLTGRRDTPWYPTMRLFRQKVLGDWSTVFAEVVEELRSRQP